MTPIYNTFILIFAGVFAYFICIEQPECYSKDQKAYGVEYSNTENVTEQFYWLSAIGLTLLLLQAAAYHTQTRIGMFDAIRPFVILVNLMSLIWFFSLQYFRFRDPGRACSGDFLAKSLFPAFSFGSEEESGNMTTGEGVPVHILRD